MRTVSHCVRPHDALCFSFESGWSRAMDSWGQHVMLVVLCVCRVCHCSTAPLALHPPQPVDRRSMFSRPLLPRKPPAIIAKGSILKCHCSSAYVLLRSVLLHVKVPPPLRPGDEAATF